MNIKLDMSILFIFAFLQLATVTSSAANYQSSRMAFISTWSRVRNSGVNSDNNHHRFESSDRDSSCYSEKYDSITYAEAWRIRTRLGHDAALPHYKQLLSKSFGADTSAATRIAALDTSLTLLDNVARPSASSLEWREDIEKLRTILAKCEYNHMSIEKIFKGSQGDPNSLEHHKNNNSYPFGPIYVKPLSPGQYLDAHGIISGTTQSNSTLKCLTILFLLSGCISKSLFLKAVHGKEETLNLFQRLGILFIFNDHSSNAKHDEVIVPLVHLFPLDIPAFIQDDSQTKENLNTKIRTGKSLIIMTDLHPNVLGLTSIPTQYHEESDIDVEDGTVMYIGGDSLALVHHLHAIFMQLCSSSSSPSSGSPFRLLDCCTGSGIQALATLSMLELLPSPEYHSAIGIQSSEKLAVAVDINRRALRFTEFNSLLNGFGVMNLHVKEDLGRNSQMKVYTQHADLVGGTTREGKLLIDELLLLLDQKNNDTKFDILLANPPFIPTPPQSCNFKVLSVYGNGNCTDTRNVPVYGLFSSGGEDGEACLRAILQITNQVLKVDGIAAIVSEFMNPNCWHSNVSSPSLLFTNEYAISADIYANRRAMPNDVDDLELWTNHLIQMNISSVSPGILFVIPHNDTVKQQMVHKLVPKTDLGSIWTPHNYKAVDFIRKSMLEQLNASNPKETGQP